MLRCVVRISCFFALVLPASLLQAQNEFSADGVGTRGSGTPIVMKLYFGKDKVRFDPVEKSSGDQAAGIVNFKTQTVTVLMKQRQMYMELPAQMTEQRLIYNFFRAGDPENACADWQKILHNQGGTCQKVGHDPVNGRDAVKYQGTNSKGESGYFWIDSRLRFPVKWQEKGNTGGELRNIQEGAQPASLFEIPAGYTKMEIGPMMQQLQ